MTILSPDPFADSLMEEGHRFRLRYNALNQPDPGHAILLTNSSGGIMEQYEYDAFGQPYFYNATGGALTVNGQPGSPHGNRFLFTGREYVSELKLYDYRHRLYQPELGRFLQPDPKHFAADDYNLYRYCHNDPVNHSDPTGLAIDTIADIGFIGYDIYKLVTEGGGQGGENWKALGLDTGAAFVPFATGAGVAYRTSRHAENAIQASSAINRVQLGIQLAKQEQAAQLVAGKGIPMAGAGTDKVLREAGRLAETYGGKAGDWSKVTSGHYKAPDGTRVETHAYQNTKTGEVVEMKDKFPLDKRHR